MTRVPAAPAVKESVEAVSIVARLPADAERRCGRRSLQSLVRSIFVPATSRGLSCARSSRRLMMDGTNAKHRQHPKSAR